MSTSSPGPHLAYRYTHCVPTPFRTRAGAEYYAKWGYCNSFCRNVADAEALAKELDELYDINRGADQ